MLTKAIFGVLAIALTTTYLGPVVFKLKDTALTIVVLIGLAMIVYDFIGSLREKD